jgi:hypothetical protein
MALAQMVSALLPAQAECFHSNFQWEDDTRGRIFRERRKSTTAAAVRRSIKRSKLVPLRENRRLHYSTKIRGE